MPEIDKTRATAVLVRQSKSGADTAMAESRETQLGLQEFAGLLYDNTEPHVELYDEGAGVSGQKRIDQREHLDRLYRDMNKGIIGTIILAREDRLFRNKHMDQVGVFTRMAEEKRVKVIVPPISSNYLGYRKPNHQMTRSRSCCIPGVAFDGIVIERLLALGQADIEMKDRVKTTLEQVYNQQSEDFVSIPQQIDGIKIQLVDNAKKRMRTSVDDPMYAKLEVEKHDLTERQKALEAKKEKLGMVDTIWKY